VAPTDAELPVGVLLAIVADPGEPPAAQEIEAALAADQGQPPAASPKPVPDAASDTAAGAVPEAKTKAVPKARALARELGIDLRALTGTGPSGEITVADVRAAERPPERDRVREVRPLTAVGRAMAASVRKSWSVPQFTQTALVDATTLTRRKSDDLTYTHLLIDAVVRAAAEVPEVNSALHGDDHWIYDVVDVSVAVATERGLLLPVLRAADRLSLADRAAALRDLVRRAHEGSLGPDDMADGTISVSNLGTHGVDGGVPLLVHPQAALVFAGELRDRPLVVDGSVQARPTIPISIAYDHRIIDGALAAGFTGAVRAHLEA
jgi:pyruvate dehydrogenase E2 component (dihydrolipoamide acetyltransferase)